MKKLSLLILISMLTFVAQSQVVLKSGKSILLELSMPVESNSAVQGQSVDFRVVNDVVVDGKLIIPAGTLAKGVVRRVQRSKGAGRSGVIDIQVESINVDGQTVPLTSNHYQIEGENKKALAWGLAGGGFFVVGPLSFFFLLIKGEQAVIQAGTKMDATVLSNVTIDQR